VLSHTYNIKSRVQLKGGQHEAHIQALDKSVSFFPTRQFNSLDYIFITGICNSSHGY